MISHKKAQKTQKENRFRVQPSGCCGARQAKDSNSKQKEIPVLEFSLQGCCLGPGKLKIRTLNKKRYRFRVQPSGLLWARQAKDSNSN